MQTVDGEDARRSDNPSAWRVWAALLTAPLALALPFVPVVGFMSAFRGLQGDALFRAIEQVAPLPASFGFVLILLLTRFQATRDGFRLETIGWHMPPPPKELAIGAGIGVAVAFANELWLYPLVQRFQPDFDPSLRNLPLWSVILMMVCAIAAEDTLYRGYALVRLRERYGVCIAVASSSVFYAILTPGPDIPLKIWALMFGVVLAGTRLARDSLWPVAAAHAVVSLGPRIVASIGSAATSM